MEQQEVNARERTATEARMDRFFMTKVRLIRVGFYFQIKRDSSMN